jgi:hypothetical protein
MNNKQIVQVFKALMQGPFSRMELAKQTSTCPKAVGRLLKEMKAQKMVYVIGYQNRTDGRNRVKIYSIGDGVDAEPKRTQSQQDRSRKSYLKKLAKQKSAVIKTSFVGGQSLWANTENSAGVPA